ncbi:condensation domain-containing protein [Dactylosporangium sp. NPDC049525]|uniref:condensation domain-containing protein n=1 Tax=Dactylosporangium sp. NPDC049525 TaxID=3154730 RepID=UPI003416B067
MTPPADPLTDVVLDELRALAAEPGAPAVRVLQIGAGAAGRTAALLDRLGALAVPVEEYRCTDVDDAALRGLRAAVTDPGYLRLDRLDPRQPLDGQGVAPGSYDLLIVPDGFGAAGEYRRAVRTVKAALARDALLVLRDAAAGSEPGGAVLSTEGFTDVEVLGHGATRVLVGRSDGLVRRDAPDTGAPARTAGAAGAVRTPAPTGEHGRIVRQTVIDTLADALGLAAGQVEPDVSFADFGLNSVSGVRFLHSLNEALGTRLESTVIFDYSSADRLAAHILAEGLVAAPAPPAVTPARTPTPAPAPVVVSAPAPRTPTAADGVAVIGMSGQFAHSENLDQLWAHLRDGDSLVDEVTRWDLDAFYARFPASEHGYCRRASLLDGVDLFDPQFFGISGLEATYMDPQQRLFLEQSWAALEDAGHVGAGAAGLACGVFAGYNGSDYHHLCGVNPPAQAMWGNAASVLSARIAYFLDLQGPALTIDTACSSSLVAIQLACQGLTIGELDLALAGGVYVSSTPGFMLGASQAGMLSPDGTCYSFDSRANGFVPGEGVGVLVLKRLADALADGDHIHGVIRGWGTNQDGATNGITAPSARSQERLERHVYDRFGIDPAGIGMVEAHGSATPLGDPIEFQALSRAFAAHTDARGYCALGSIKTNVGHTTSAAGVAGALRVLLALRHHQIPPSLNFDRPNPQIDFTQSPFYLNTKTVDWPAPDGGAPRRGAVSSFGLSGTNAHLVIEEAPPVTDRHRPRSAHLIVLSARSPEQLREQAERLAAHCADQPGLDLGDAAFTLLTGRRRLRHRLACVAGDPAELAGALRGYVRGERPAGVLTGHVAADEPERAMLRRFGEQCVRDSRDREGSELAEHLQAVGELFVQGYELDYAGLFAGDRYRRVPLPTYPFARERYWAPGPGTPELPAAPVAAAVVVDAPVGDVDDVPGALTASVAGLLALPADRIDPDAPLLAHGFDSINAVALSRHVRDVYGADLSARDIFEGGTLRAVIGLVTGMIDAGATPAVPAVPAAADPAQAGPLSAGQGVLWAVQQLAPHSTAYHLPHAFRIRGPVDPEALRTALLRLADRHPALRATFTVEGAEPVQRADGAPPALELLDARYRGNGQIAAMLRDRTDAPFDLERGPLLRAHLLTRADDDHILLTVTHHLVFDGTSLMVFMRELTVLYLAARSGRELPLPALEASYADFVAWERGYLAGERGGRDAGYWRDRLADPPPALRLPTDRPRGEATRFSGAVLERQLPAELTGRIADLALATGASPFVVMLGAFAAELRHWSGQDELLIGTPLQGRPERRFEGLIGYFMNQVPIRVRAGAGQTFAALTADVRTAVYEAFDHGEYPVSELGLGAAADVRVTFVFQNWLEDPRRALRPDGDVADADLLPLEPILGLHQQGMFDLTLELVRTGEAYTMLLLYNPELFDPATVDGFAGRYADRLAAACDDATVVLGPVPQAAPSPSPSLEPAPAATEADVRAVVTAAFQEALGVDDIDPADNFFDLGGHSVLLVNLTLKLRAALGRDVQSVELFQNPTIDALVRHLSPASTGPSYERSRRKGLARRAALARMAVPA